MGKFHKHNVEGKKPDAECALYDSTCMKFKNRKTNLGARSYNNGYLGVSDWEGSGDELLGC